MMTFNVAVLRAADSREGRSPNAVPCHDKVRKERKPGCREPWFSCRNCVAIGWTSAVFYLVVFLLAGLCSLTASADKVILCQARAIALS